MLRQKELLSFEILKVSQKHRQTSPNISGIWVTRSSHGSNTSEHFPHFNTNLSCCVSVSRLEMAETVPSESDHEVINFLAELKLENFSLSF